MLEEMPTVELRGEEYDLEPLGIADIFKLKKLLQKIGEDVASELDTDSINLMKLGQASNLQQMRVLSIAIDQSESKLYELLGIITGLDEKVLKNKEKVPADAPLKILTIFYEEHPDIQEYKEQMGKLSGKETGNDKE